MEAALAQARQEGEALVDQAAERAAAAERERDSLSAQLDKAQQGQQRLASEVDALQAAADSAEAGRGAAEQRAQALAGEAAALQGHVAELEAAAAAAQEQAAALESERAALQQRVQEMEASEQQAAAGAGGEGELDEGLAQRLVAVEGQLSSAAQAASAAVGGAQGWARQGRGLMRRAKGLWCPDLGWEGLDAALGHQLPSYRASAACSLFGLRCYPHFQRHFLRGSALLSTFRPCLAAGALAQGYVA